MAWYNLDLDPNFPDHPKIVQLRQKHGHEAVASYIYLLCWAAKHATDGQITKHAGRQYIESVVMTLGDESQAVLDTMIELKLIDQHRGGKLAIHGFKERQNHILKLRKAQKDRAMKRWATEKPRESNDDSNSQVRTSNGVTPMPRHKERNAMAYAPTTHPSNQPSNQPTTPTTQDDNGGGGGRTPGHFKTMMELHRDTFKSPPGKAIQADWVDRISRDGIDLKRWKFAYHEAQRGGAKNFRYVLRAYDNYRKPKPNRNGSDQRAKAKDLPGRVAVFDPRTGEHLGYK